MYKHLPTRTGPNSTEIETEWIRQALYFRASDKKYPHCEVVTVKTPNDQNSDTWNIQRNKRANKRDKQLPGANEDSGFQLRTVVWTKKKEAVDESVLMNETGRGLGRGFVRSLMKEDRIAVMARAQVS
jgi:hypothetical protein